jgi:uncharacterized membrane protein
MNKTRLEAFSDGVFAIVITLLILNVKLPEVDYTHLTEGLLALLPTVGVYVLSFMLIGLHWVFHHYSFLFIKEVDGLILWLNILFLLMMSFLPFPTMLLGKYPFQSLPLIIYGANLILANVFGVIYILYLRLNPQLTTTLFTPKLFKQQIFMYAFVTSVYIVSIIIAAVNPTISIVLFGFITLFQVTRSVVFMGIGKCRIPANVE